MELTLNDEMNQLTMAQTVIEPLFKDPEVLDWIATLTVGNTVDGWRRCRSKDEQIHAIKDLLKHSGKDHMTRGDQMVCIRALEILNPPELGQLEAS